MNPQLWQPLIDSMLEGVWIVDAIELRIQAANRNAARLLDLTPEELLGKPVVDLAATPADVYFWEDVAAGLTDQIQSETLLLRADGVAVPVERRVCRIVLPDATMVFVVGLRDQTEDRRLGDELERLVAELRATLESTADGILVTGLDGAIRSYNRHFAELWSLPEELLTQRADAAIYAWLANSVADAAVYAARLAAIAQAPLLESSDTLVLRSGRILERIALPQYARGRPIGRVYSFRDITQRLRDETELKLAAKVFEASLDAVFITTPDYRIVTANPSCERLTGLTREEITGRSAFEILTGGDQHKHFGELVRRRLASTGFWEGEAWHRNRSGTALPCLVSLVRVTDAAGGLLNYIGFFKDLSETVNARKRIEELAYTDALTGLPNRLLLAERIDFAIGIAAREQRRFAVLFIDLDRFKHINDSLGHQFGDRVLIEITRRIKGCLRHADTAARLGGDEFLVLLHQLDAHSAEVTAQRILDRLAQPIDIDDMSFSITCSIGIAFYPEDGRTMDDLIKNADAAMYHVKERGRTGFRFYQRQMNVDLLSRMKLAHALRQALADGALRLHYQPQVRFGDRRIFGAEALLRWRDPDLGEISPGQFIPVAEETGLIVPIGQWVMREAVRQCAHWNRQGTALLMAVNVSALQFHQADFVDELAGLLRETGLPPRQLELELTESILVQDVDETMRRLNALAALGVRLLIDDFGTGYSSLAYLKRFPIDKLKIDRSFISGLPGDESDAAIVDAIFRLADALRLAVIAEGVETESQRDFLIAAGCREYQGFLCSPALDAAAFENFLAAYDREQASATLNVKTKRTTAQHRQKSPLAGQRSGRQ